jgi:hypothetical protein
LYDATGQFGRDYRQCKLFGGPMMDTQVTKRVVSFSVQIAPLVVLAAVVRALAAKYMW